MKSILDKSFKYVPAAATDIRKTWAKARKELADKQKQPRIIIPILRAK